MNKEFEKHKQMLLSFFESGKEMSEMEYCTFDKLKKHKATKEEQRIVKKLKNETYCPMLITLPLTIILLFSSFCVKYADILTIILFIVLTYHVKLLYEFFSHTNEEIIYGFIYDENWKNGTANLYIPTERKFLKGVSISCLVKYNHLQRSGNNHVVLYSFHKGDFDYALLDKKGNII